MNLPSKDEMSASVQAYRKRLESEYSASRRHTIQVNYVQYMWDVAGRIGCAPSLRKYHNAHINATQPILFMILAPGPQHCL